LIDEWGNEIQENKILTVKEKIIKNRNLIFFLISAFIFTIIILQIIPIFLVKKPSTSPTTSNLSPSPSLIPKTQRILSSVASESAFIDLEQKTATLSGQINGQDLYESTLVFPDLSTQIKIQEKSSN
jgi:hypothetical protein